MKKIVLFCLFLLVTGAAVVSCTSDLNDVGKNGNNYLAEGAFANCGLVPSFSAYTNSYEIFIGTNTKMFVKLIPAYYKAQVFINGQRFTPATNGLGLPDYTDYTKYIDATKKIDVKVFGEDGQARQYSFTPVTEASDASIDLIQVVAQTNNAVAAGVVYPKFTEGVAPDFRAVGFDSKENFFTVGCSIREIELVIDRRSQNAKTFIKDSVGNTSGSLSGAKSVSYSLTLSSLGTPRNIFITNISADDKYTNVKVITNATFFASTADARVLDVSLNGKTGFFPEFYYGTTQYYGAVEGTQLEVKCKKTQSGQAVYIAKTSLTDYETNAAWDSYIENPENLASAAGAAIDVSKTVTVTMGDTVIIRVKPSDPLKANREYLFKVGVFSRTPYGFDGGIKALLDDITLKGENFTKVVVQGIITLKDFWGWENAKKCMFIEDDKAGLYVFLNDAVYAGLRTKPDGRFKIGSKVSMRISAGQIYYGMAEAVGIDELTLLDGTPKPLLIRSGGFDRVFSRGKLWKHTATVKTSLTKRGEGTFTDGSLYLVNRYSTYSGNPPLPEVTSFFNRFTTGFNVTVYGPVIWSYSYHRIALFRPEYALRTIPGE